MNNLRVLRNSLALACLGLGAAFALSGCGNSAQSSVSSSPAAVAADVNAVVLSANCLASVVQAAQTAQQVGSTVEKVVNTTQAVATAEASQTCTARDLAVLAAVKANTVPVAAAPAK